MSVDLHKRHLSLVGRARAPVVQVRAVSKLVDERSLEQRLPLKVHEYSALGAYALWDLFPARLQLTIFFELDYVLSALIGMP